MDFYELLVFIHVCGAVTWLGCGVALQALSLKAASGSRSDKQQTLYISQWFSQKVFGAAGMITIVAGFALIGIGWSHLRDMWIVAALAAIVLSFILLGVQLKPLVKQLTTSKLSEATFDRLFQKYLWVTQLDLVLLFFVLYAMVVKPQHLNASFWLGVAIAVLAAAAVTFKRFRQQSQP